MQGSLESTRFDDETLAPRRGCPRRAVEGILPTVANAAGRRIKVEVSFPPNPWEVGMPEEELSEILLSLALDACDAMPKGGPIRVTVSNLVLEYVLSADPASVPPGDYSVIEVEDHGVGMDQESRSRVFDPGSTRRGLPTIWNLVRGCGGTITVDSQLDSGTVFRIYLPRSSTVTASPHTAVAG